MSDVKRYVVGGVLPFGPHKDERLMIERARGQWIKASDYDALAAKLAAAERDAARWHDGAPPKPFDSEWFIAELKSGDRVVLRALPEEYAYDFKTADETYVKKYVIVRWMRFPDSQFVPFAAMAPRSGVEGEQP